MRDAMTDAEAAPMPAVDDVPVDADGFEGAGSDPQSVVREVLRAHGLRYSRPREAILAFMAEEARHASAEALYQALRDRGEDLSLSTVYLNLGVLVEAGLLREFKGAHGESLFDASVEPHYHLICRDTGEVVDVPMPAVDGVALSAFLKAYVERMTGWQVDEAHLSLRGRRRSRAVPDPN